MVWQYFFQELIMQQHFCVCLSSVHWRNHSFVHSTIVRRSFVRPCVRSFIHSYFHSFFIHPSIRSFVHSFIFWFVRSLVRSFIVQRTSHNVVPELINQSSSQIIAQSTDDQNKTKVNRLFTECVRLYQVLTCYVICLYTQPTDLYVHKKKTDFIE